MLLRFTQIQASLAFGLVLLTSAIANGSTENSHDSHRPIATTKAEDVQLVNVAAASTEDTASRNANTAEPAQTSEIAAGSPDSVKALDDLIRQARQRAIPAHEALLRRLQSRKEVGDALKEALAVADEVARFGNAGVKLLNDAKLEKVIELLIEDRKRAELALTATQLPPIVEPVRTSMEVLDDSVDSDDESAFEGYVPVFVQHAPLPLRVGLRHRRTGEFLIVRAGETKRVKKDNVRFLRIRNRQGEQELEFEVNGEEWRATIR